MQLIDYGLRSYRDIVVRSDVQVNANQRIDGARGSAMWTAFYLGQPGCQAGCVKHVAATGDAHIGRW